MKTWNPILCFAMMTLAGTAEKPAAEHGSAPNPGLDEFLRTKYDAIPLSADASQSHFFIPVEINGIAGRMQVDTGCNTSNLYAGSLAKFGMVRRETGERIIGIGGEAPRFCAEFESLVISGKIRKAAGSLDVQDGWGPLGADGILGTDMLGDHGALVDLGQAVLWLPRPDVEISAPELSAALRSHGWEAVPLVRWMGVVMFSGEINGASARLLLDTGAQQPLIDVDLAQRAGLHVYETFSHAVGTGGASSQLGYCCPEAIRLGNFEVRGLACMVSDLAPIRAQGIHGMIGGEMLSRLQAVFDLDRSIVYFTRKPVDLRDVGVFPGALPEGVEPRRLLDQYPLVFTGLRAGPPQKIPDTQEGDEGGSGTVWEIPYRIHELFCDAGGTRSAGARVSVRVRAPDAMTAAHLEERLSCALVTMDPSAPESPLDSTLRPGSPRRSEQLRAARSAP
ncbi:MAG: aspartyl protease family protein [Kiritimatiellae bacterium]|nr:aspartyl protease family protein [Kiritimatiellia bacterium]